MLGLHNPIKLSAALECYYQLELKSRNFHPQTLALSADSRMETLRHYTPILVNELSNSLIYFYPDIDTLAFNANGIFEVPRAQRMFQCNPNDQSVTQVVGNLSVPESGLDKSGLFVDNLGT
jgi:hypothetical protein